MKLRILLIALIINSLVLISCYSVKNESQSGSDLPYTVWFSNPSEYRTNVLSVAQAETPFTIVLPSYLPPTINSIPQFSGPAKSEFGEWKSVDITYRTKNDSNPLIFIEEYYMTIKAAKSDNTTFLNFLNTQVQEDKANHMAMTGDGKAYIADAYFYSWNRNDIHVQVTISEIEREEARKIIESMIK